MSTVAPPAPKLVVKSRVNPGKPMLVSEGASPPNQYGFIVNPKSDGEILDEMLAKLAITPDQHAIKLNSVFDGFTARMQQYHSPILDKQEVVFTQANIRNSELPLSTGKSAEVRSPAEVFAARKLYPLSAKKTKVVKKR